MPEFMVEVEFEVYCAVCGTGLCNQSTAHDESGYGSRTRGRHLDVEPCPKCLEVAEDKGYDKGYQDAEKDARDSR